MMFLMGLAKNPDDNSTIEDVFEMTFGRYVGLSQSINSVYTLRLNKDINCQ